MWKLSLAQNLKRSKKIKQAHRWGCQCVRWNHLSLLSSFVLEESNICRNPCTICPSPIQFFWDTTMGGIKQCMTRLDSRCALNILLYCKQPPPTRQNCRLHCQYPQFFVTNYWHALPVINASQENIHEEKNLTGDFWLNLPCNSWAWLWPNCTKYACKHWVDWYKFPFRDFWSGRVIESHLEILLIPSFNLDNCPNDFLLGILGGWLSFTHSLAVWSWSMHRKNFSGKKL